MSKQTGQAEDAPEQGGVFLLDVAIVLAKHKRLVLGLPLGAALVTAAIVTILPKTYTASAKILTPQQSQSSATLLLGQLGGFSGGTASALGLKNPNDVFVAMLRSRSVADRLIEKFNLKGVYGVDLMDDTRKRLVECTAIASGIVAAMIILYLWLASPTRPGSSLVFGPAGVLVAFGFSLLGAWAFPYLRR